MAESLGSAVLELTTDDSAFTDGVNKAEKGAKRLDKALDQAGRQSVNVGRRLSDLGGRVADMGRRLVSLRSAMVAAAGVGGFLLLEKAAVGAADQIGKTSARIGLTAEAFQEFQFAAERAGVDLEQFNQALTALVRRQGDAIAGNQGFIDAFKRIGISVQELRQLDTEQLFLRVADAMAEIPDVASRVAAADAVMSEAGRRLINVFEGGARSIQDVRAEARALGVVLSNDMVASAEVAADRIGDMEKVLSVAGQNIMLQFVPAMEAVADIITDPDFVAGVRTFADGIGRAVRELFGGGTALDQLKDKLVNLDARLARLRSPDTLTGLTSDAEADSEIVFFWLDGQKDRLQIIKELEAERLELLQQIRAEQEKAAAPAKVTRIDVEVPHQPPTDLEKALARLDVQIGVLTGRYAGLAEGTAEAAHAFGILDGAADYAASDIAGNLNPELAELDKRMRALAQARAAAQVIAETRTAAERYATTIEELNKLLKAGAIDQDTHARAVAKAKTELEAASEEGRETEEVVRTLGLSFESAFEDAVIGGAGIREVLAGIIEDIARLILRLLVVEPIVERIARAIKESQEGGSGGGGGGIFSTILGGVLNGIGGAFGGGSGLGAGGGALAFTNTPTSSVPTSFGFSAFAEGGRPPLGRASLVGEFGPELFIPDQSGTIIPNHALDSIGRGGGGNAYYIDARGADAAAIARLERTLVDELGPGRIEHRAVAAVVDARQRDPGLFGDR